MHRCSVDRHLGWLLFRMQRYYIFFPIPNFYRVERGIVRGVERGIEPKSCQFLGVSTLLDADAEPLMDKSSTYIIICMFNARICM